ncbi:DUF2007 domain-containing protein [Weeksellaceae bacterium TAE3-ERU29]|nr:DUF2007 domain-containing protein [Weeksellaceae bacterium TAE3-ERU29]
MKLVTLYTFTNSFEAQVVKGKLESEGIQAFIIDENTNYTIGPTILEGARLQVEEKDFLQAKHILEKTLQES